MAWTFRLVSQYVYSLTRFQSSVVFFVLCMRLCGRANWSACALPVHDSSVVAVVRALVFLSSASLVGPQHSSGRFVSQCFRLFLLRSFVRTLVGSRLVAFVSLYLRAFVLSLFRSFLCWFAFLCARL